MAKAAPSPVLQFLHWVARVGPACDLPDHDLLRRFHAQRDEAAFHALLRRHGPMVLDVCRAASGNDADAEDAFQATFLALARQAGAIRKAASLASWLHGVAYRTALKARARAGLRRRCEARLPPREASEFDDLTWREVRQVLHEELNGLADRYRAPLVLCYLEGKTQEQAANELGVAKSTLRERLERGRELLRARLARRGLGAPALLATTWPTAGVPLAVAEGTVRAVTVPGLISAEVVALTEGVVPTMMPHVVKIAAAAIGALAAAVALVPAEGQPPPAAPAVAAPPKDDIPAWKKELRESYALAAGEVLRRVAPPYPACRAEFIKVAGFNGDHPNPPPIFLSWRIPKGPPGELQNWGMHGGEATVWSALTMAACVPREEVQADRDLLNTVIGGDFVFREDATVTERVQALERVLRKDCKLPVRLTFRDEREVVVARGTLRVKPLEGRAKNHVEVYGSELLPFPPRPALPGRPPSLEFLPPPAATLPDFLRAVGGFINRPIVHEAEAGPGETVTFDLHAPLVGGPEAAFRDPDKVIKHVAEQTGLTFHAEKRKLRVLVVEKAEP